MNDDELIAHARRHFPEVDMTGFNVMDVLYVLGSPFAALLYERLLAPRFVEIEGMTLIRESVEDDDDKRRLREALKRYGSRTQTEQAFNTFDIDAIFAPRNDGTTEEEIRALFGVLRARWADELRRLYPTKLFQVELIEPGAGDEFVSLR